MALFRPSSIVETISGELGGVVFVTGAGGRYLRTSGPRVNYQTARQVGRRRDFAEIVQAWSALTSSQRLAWNALGARIVRVDRVGVQKNYGGRQLFIRENAIRARVGIAQLVDPPVGGARQAFARFRCDWSGASLILRCDRYSGGGSGDALFYGYRSFSFGGFTAKNPTLFLRTPFTANFVVNATTFFANNFGIPEVGEYFMVRCVAVFTGFLASLPVDVTTTRV